MKCMWNISHVSYVYWMGHGSYSICIIYGIWVMSLMYMEYEPCLICIWNMSHVSYVYGIWVMSLMYESCLLYHTNYMNRRVRWLLGHVSYIWVVSLIHESCLLYMSHFSCTIWTIWIDKCADFWEFPEGETRQVRRHGSWLPESALQGVSLR